MQKTTPIKRSAQLAPLSREHHEGLLLVWKIRQGLKMNVEVERIKNYCIWFWQQHLQDHFRKEEETLLPVLNNQSLKDQLLKEHAELTVVFNELVNQASGELLQKLSDILEKHIRFEERVLFNEIERTASKEQLEKIADQLTETKKTSEEWQDEFWLTKK